MLTPPAAAATGEPEASAAGLALAISTPALPIDDRLSHRVAPEERPRLALDTSGHWPADGQNARAGQGLRDTTLPACRTRPSCRRCSCCRECSVVVLPRTTVPPPALSITLNWPGPVRVPRVTLLLSQRVWPLASTVAILLAAVPTVMGIAVGPIPPGPAWSVPAVEVEGGGANAPRFRERRPTDGTRLEQPAVEVIGPGRIDGRCRLQSTSI